MHRRTIRAVVLAIAPFGFSCFSVAWWDRVHPLVLGLPFNLFWLLCGMVFISACLALTRVLAPPKDGDP